MTFTASNDIPVRRTNRGYLSFTTTSDIELGTLNGVSVEQETALREFFQHERDEELGRWRWPENPDYVVYPAAVKSRVRVLRETGMADLEWVDRGDERSYEFCHAARAYFEAHPERKPWHEAKPGEVWVLTIDGREEVPCAAIAYDCDFVPISHPRFAKFANGSEHITAARRIWPES